MKNEIDRTIDHSVQEDHSLLQRVDQHEEEGTERYESLPILKNGNDATPERSTIKRSTCLMKGVLPVYKKGIFIAGVPT